MQKITLLFLLLCAFASAQERQVVNGKIVSTLSDLEGIYITNLSLNETVTSTEGGYFSIYAREMDSLRFSAVYVKGKTIVLGREDLSAELLFVPLEPLITEIEEVKIIQYKNINAEALGIIPKGQKKYTPAERRLQTASGYMGIGPGASLDGLINAISGRTAMLKKEVKVERKQMLMERILEMYEVEFFTETLKIPKEYIDGFCFYLVEDSKFASAVNKKNRTMATFLIGDLAVEYLKLIGYEK